MWKKADPGGNDGFQHCVHVHKRGFKDEPPNFLDQGRSNSSLTVTFCLSYGFQSIALFSANEHRDAIMRIKELASTSSSDVDPIPCCIVEVRIVHSTSAWFVY